MGHKYFYTAHPKPEFSIWLLPKRKVHLLLGKQGLQWPLHGSSCKAEAPRVFRHKIHLLRSKFRGGLAAAGRVSALLGGVFVPGLRAIMGAAVGSGPSPVEVGHNRGDVALLQGSKSSSCSCAGLWKPWEWFILQLLVTRLDTVAQQCPVPLDLTSASNAEALMLHKPKGHCY